MTVFGGRGGSTVVSYPRILLDEFLRWLKKRHIRLVHLFLNVPTTYFIVFQRTSFTPNTFKSCP